MESSEIVFRDCVCLNVYKALNMINNILKMLYNFFLTVTTIIQWGLRSEDLT